MRSRWWNPAWQQRQDWPRKMQPLRHCSSAPIRIGRLAEAAAQRKTLEDEAARVAQARLDTENEAIAKITARMDAELRAIEADNERIADEVRAEEAANARQAQAEELIAAARAKEEAEVRALNMAKLKTETLEQAHQGRRRSRAGRCACRKAGSSTHRNRGRSQTPDRRTRTQRNSRTYSGSAEPD